VKQIASLALAAAILAGCAVTVVQPDRHPAYLHALSNLRAARWALNHRPGGFAVSGDEAAAVGEIDAVIQDVKHAAFDDGKNLNDHPHADEVLDYRGRLHRALDLLNQTHRNLAQEEDSPESRELRNRSLAHLDRAIQLVHKALFDAHFD
jgi:hypothetical protein